MFLDQLIAEELLEEPMRVPSGCPVADLEGAADMDDDLRHRARPVDGVPDLGPDWVEAQNLALIEVEQDRLLLNEASGNVLVSRTVCAIPARAGPFGIASRPCRTFVYVDRGLPAFDGS